MAQVLLEIALPASLGGILGVLIALGAIGFIKSAGPVYSLYRFQKVELDPVALLFVLGATILVALLSGIPPALGLSQVKLGSALKDEGGRSGTVGLQQQTTQSVLVVGQVALACALLVGAGLLVRSFKAAQDLPLGFNPHDLLTANITPKATKYTADMTRYRQLFNSVLEKARQLPGVTAAAMNEEQPFEWVFGDVNLPFRVLGQPLPEPGHEPTMCRQNISPGYFGTIQIPVLQGRDFNQADRSDTQKVTIIDRALAEHFFPGQNPIGRQIQSLASWGLTEAWTIVGVVQNSRHNSPDHGLAPFQAYFPYNQQIDLDHQFLLIRTQGDPTTLIPEVRKIVAEVDPDIPVTRMMTFDDLMAEKSATSRLSVLLVGIFPESLSFCLRSDFMAS